MTTAKAAARRSVGEPTWGRRSPRRQSVWPSGWFTRGKTATDDAKALRTRITLLPPPWEEGRKGGGIPEVPLDDGVGIR